jgi:hypothetical protein
MQARPMWKKEVKLDKREKALAAHWLYRQIKVVVMNIHRRCLPFLFQDQAWEMVACQSTSVFPYRETEASLHQSCPVLRKATQSAVAWLLLAWNLHTAFCPFSASNWTWCGTQRNRLFPSNHRSHRPLRHRTWSHVADCRHLPAVRSIPGLFSMAAWLGGALRRARQTTGLVILISATVASSPTFRSKRSWRVTLIAKSQRSLNCWSLDK